MLQTRHLHSRTNIPTSIIVFSEDKHTYIIVEAQIKANSRGITTIHHCGCFDLAVIQRWSVVIQRWYNGRPNVLINKAYNDLFKDLTPIHVVAFT